MLRLGNGFYELQPDQCCLHLHTEPKISPEILRWRLWDNDNDWTDEKIRLLKYVGIQWRRDRLEYLIQLPTYTPLTLRALTLATLKECFLQVKVLWKHIVELNYPSLLKLELYFLRNNSYFADAGKLTFTEAYMSLTASRRKAFMLYKYRKAASELELFYLDHFFSDVGLCECGRPLVRTPENRRFAESLHQYLGIPYTGITQIFEVPQ